MAKTSKLTAKEYSRIAASHFETGVHSGKLNALWHILEQTEQDIVFYAIEAYLRTAKRRAEHRKWKADQKAWRREA